jgi:hypothetical protein
VGLQAEQLLEDGGLSGGRGQRSVEAGQQHLQQVGRLQCRTTNRVFHCSRQRLAHLQRRRICPLLRQHLHTTSESQLHILPLSFELSVRQVFCLQTLPENKQHSQD